MIDNEIIQKYQQRLLKSDKCLRLLAERKVSMAAVRRFGVGYFDTNPSSKYMDRMVFPIRSIYGEIVSFQGRAMFDHEARSLQLGKKIPKYYHGDYDKGDHVYGLFESARSIVDKGYVVIVEGPFDVMALFEAGIPAVAFLGTALSQEQALLVRRYTDKAVLWLDQDKAGLIAKGRMQELLNELGFEVSEVIPPEPLDPSDLWVKYGREYIKRIASKRQ